MAKQQPDLRIDRLGTHLFNITRKDGSTFLKWDWDALLKEVQIATSGRKVQYLDIGDMPPQEAVALVKEIETKVKKTRVKKITEATPATKKPAAKKAATKKSVKPTAAKKTK